ncbi:hypothetical protein QVD17_04555 [Tagetes erecta]|uniref:Uncharacterized protein n=1 Tax=Tagetes erecta TaxID=13708 RepID=A0AAD8LJS6_TARER|nr:hypothetical protein QVD17_04555 [Tagetes erecta]
MPVHHHSHSLCPPNITLNMLAAPEIFTSAPEILFFKRQCGVELYLSLVHARLTSVFLFSEKSLSHLNPTMKTLSKPT